MKTKKQTVRFYADGNIYKGWQYVYTVSFREARNWLRSGNTLVVGKKVFNSFSSETSILKVFTK